MKKAKGCTWMQEYQEVSREQDARSFSFLPGGPVDTPQQIIQALEVFAGEKDLELTVLSREECPEFLLNGVRHTACKAMACCCSMPDVLVKCERTERTKPENGEWRLMRMIHDWWPVPPAVLVFGLLAQNAGAALWQSWLLAGGLVGCAALMLHWLKGRRE